jgi:prophage regulatory protein
MDTRRLLKLRQVQQIAGLPKSTLYRKIHRGEFPAPVHQGLRSVAWLSDEIESWVSDRVAASRPVVDLTTWRQGRS